MAQGIFPLIETFYSPQNLYKEAWDRVKATSYIMPSDAVSLARAKELKHNASIVSQ